MIINTNFNDQDSIKLNEYQHNWYRRIIGCLRYLTTTVRPDIAYAVHHLSHHLSNPKEIHMHGLMRIVGYVKRTFDYEITYKQDKSELEAFADASHNIPDEGNKSVTGILIMFGGAPIHWISKRQTINGSSTMDSELIALNSATIYIINFRLFLYEIGWKINKPTIIFEDNNPLLC